MAAVGMGRRDLNKWAKEEFAHAIVARYEALTGTGEAGETLDGIESTYDERVALRKERDKVLKQLGFYLALSGLTTLEKKIKKAT